MQTQHISVMPEEVVHFLQPAPGRCYIDGTLGGGGHTALLLDYCAPDGRVLGIDADALALARVRERLAPAIEQGRLLLAHGNFAEMEQLVDVAGLHRIDGILLDLGFSSDQMDDPLRGFSFSADGPLDMRMDRTAERSAADIINTASEQELADIFWRYGEETRSRPLARRIVQARVKGPITRTAQLAALATAGVRYKAGAIHPATRMFQALRIAVNQELAGLEAVLPQMLHLLQRWGQVAGSEQDGHAGRMVIISFHSLEDRIVKEFMRREATDCLCPPRVPICVCGHKAQLRLLTRRPASPSQQEIDRNPRARSAHLRAAEIVAVVL